ncbi:hypothetical protein N431DRAFT_448477 [Stipitochalara longipes BDJ]|nr:hypothetical protein N431DRAFT_448477 [Stipitochalara longipes BDJ]
MTASCKPTDELDAILRRALKGVLQERKLAQKKRFDPIKSDPDLTSYDVGYNELPRAEDYRQGQEVVQRKEWRVYGITSSADYLRRLFQDNGEVVRNNQASHGGTVASEYKLMDWSKYLVKRWPRRKAI